MSAEPEVIDPEKPVQPYREGPEPCKTCAARAAAQAILLPFQPKGFECTICGIDIGGMPTPSGTVRDPRTKTLISQTGWWTKPCVGGQSFSVQLPYSDPWWKLWNRVDLKDIVVVCQIPKEIGRHFHIWCGRCHTMHAMRLANS